MAKKISIIFSSILILGNLNANATTVNVYFPYQVLSFPHNTQPVFGPPCPAGQVILYRPSAGYQINLPGYDINQNPIGASMSLAFLSGQFSSSCMPVIPSDLLTSFSWSNSHGQANFQYNNVNIFSYSANPSSTMSYQGQTLYLKTCSTLYQTSANQIDCCYVSDPNDPNACNELKKS